MRVVTLLIVAVVCLAIGYFAGKQTATMQAGKAAVLEETSSSQPGLICYDTPPEVKQSVAPEYPEVARKAGTQGMVVLKILVDTTGTVAEVQISKPVSQELDQAAVAAARQWKFSPAMQKGRPVAIWMNLPVNFQLDKK
jgi:protein TonB